MKHTKKISRAGAVGIPADLRRSYGIEPGDRYEITMGQEGAIILKRTGGSCLFCHSEENTKVYEGRQICRKCALKILNVWEG